MGLEWVIQNWLASLVLGIVIGLPITYALIWAMAKVDLVFTIVGERQVKFVEMNGKFVRALIATRGFKFRGRDATGQATYPRPPDEFSQPLFRRIEKKDLPKKKRGSGRKKPETDPEWIARIGEANEWDVVKDDLPATLRDRLFGGIRLIGIPGVHQLKSDIEIRFTHRVQKTDTEKSTGDKDEIVAGYNTGQTKPRNYISVKVENVYYGKVNNAEDQDNIPVDVDLAITMEVENPVKAVYAVKFFTETALNQIDPDVREFIRERSYKGVDDQEFSRVILFYTDVVWRIYREYGVLIKLIQMANIDPVEGYRQLTTKLTEANITRDARKAEADGERKYLEKTVGYVSGLPNGAAILAAQSIGRLQNLRAIGGGVLPTISLDDPAPSAPAPTPDPGAGSPPAAPPTPTPPPATGGGGKPRKKGGKKK